MKTELEFLKDLLNYPAKEIIQQRINQLEGVYNDRIKEYLKDGTIMLLWGHGELPVAISVSKDITLSQIEINKLKDILIHDKQYIEDNYLAQKNNNNNCLKCKHCEHELWLYSYKCSVLNIFLKSEKAENIIPPKNCPLNF